jgi:hypothetical protein
MLAGQQPRQLTAAIRSCDSVQRLAQLAAEHQAVLNPIHIAAIITKLPKLDVQGQPPAIGLSTDTGWGSAQQQQQLRQLLQQLLSRLKAQGCSDHSPRGVANIIWALAKLQCAPDPELHAMLLDSFCGQLSAAVPQDISNILWGVAKLTKEHAPVLSTAAAATSSAQDSAASGTAGSGATAPLLQQEQARLLLQQLCKQLPSASVQTISNSLWAVVVLQQEHQWCMCTCVSEVQTLVSVFSSQTEQAMPGHIQPIIRCVAVLTVPYHDVCCMNYGPHPAACIVVTHSHHATVSGLQDSVLLACRSAASHPCAPSATSAGLLACASADPGWLSRAVCCLSPGAWPSWRPHAAPTQVTAGCSGSRRCSSGC